VARAGIAPLLTLAAVLSLNLAILNILPIPALDGGRLLFVAVEVLRRGKRISPQKEALVHLAGFILLMIVVALVSYLDILRITRGESVLGG
jgi:regulator of sigma E protease